MISISRSLLFFTLLVLSQICRGQYAWYTDRLTCDYRTDPLGIDEATPHFSWAYKSDNYNQYQAAYHILVASSPEKLQRDIGDLWDSGVRADSENIQIRYGGLPLTACTRYFWKVRATNLQGMQTPWSKTAFFETGLMADSNWRGSWIGSGRPAPLKDEDFYQDRPAPAFRKEFTVRKKIVNARMYISGLGYYEASLNGSRIGTRVLDPAWTNYGKSVTYSVYDVTGQIHPGRNALGILLGNGWYNLLPLRLFGAFEFRNIFTTGEPKFIANLRIGYADGTVEWIATDRTWRTAGSHILRNDIYLGEKQDGRLVQNGWDRPGYRDGTWAAAEPQTPPGGRLQAQTAPPIRITRTLRTQAISEPAKGVYVFDLGQNFAGWIRMQIRESKGRRVQFRYGELLYPNGHVNGMTSVAGHIKEIWGLKGGPGAPRTAYQEDEYICRGNGAEVFQPHFTFHAFRYVEVTGLSSRPDLQSMSGLRLNADLPANGTFHCSDTLLDQIQRMCTNTFLSNVFSVQSDCPGRERQGYGADIVVSAEAFSFNYDMSSFYTKTIHDFANDVRPNGGMPECAPYNGISTEGFGMGAGPAGWQLAYPFLQEQQFRFYGNRGILDEQYALTKRMVNFLSEQATDRLIDHDIGDHVAVGAKHVPLTAGAFFYHHVRLLQEFAAILGKADDCRRYGELADSIRESFNRHYLQAGTGKYDTTQNQTTQVFALWYDLVPPDERTKAFDVLVNDIVNNDRGHLTTGIFATKMLFDVLRRFNRNDLALHIVRQRSYPGYGFMLANGATTLWETWEKPDQNSWNHPMFGSVSEWFYRSLAGINPADDACGMNKLVLAPYTGGGLRFAKGKISSVRGDIVSDWRIEQGVLHWIVDIPPNTIAEIVVPTANPARVREHGQVIANNDNLQVLRLDQDNTILRARSGRYQFEVR